MLWMPILGKEDKVNVLLTTEGGTLITTRWSTSVTKVSGCVVTLNTKVARF